MAYSQKVFVLNLDGFEKSAFTLKYKPVRKSDWALKTGGTNYSYAFRDPEGKDRNVSVELGSDSLFLTRFAVSFHGTSISNPATLTALREKFLRDLLASTYPDISAGKLIALVKKEQTRNYPGGSDQMPRIPLGSVNAHIGTVGESLIVGLQR